jgi:hypothetical protein
MLNPGSGQDEFDDTILQSPSIDQLVDTYIDSYINYGRHDKNRHDNFDLKQAAFLYGFKNSGIDLPDFFEVRSPGLMLAAKENVLMQKLQLELIPYCSREFVNLFDSLEAAHKNIEHVAGHVDRMLDIIVAKKRAYVLFGSKQYYYIFKALEQRGLKKIEPHEEIGFTIEGLKNRVFFNTVSVHHAGQVVNAGIAYSFPRRDLPNAYSKMKQYGDCCYREYIKRFGAVN